jgi:hypothetical protein
MKRGTSGQDLLYVSADYGVDGSVYVYSFPEGKRVGTLTGPHIPSGECVDPAGHVFIVAAASGYQSGTVYEYAHGGTSPIATLNDSGLGSGCAVDPKTGNLAVANASDRNNPYHTGFGDVAIYKSARGKPKMYYNSTFSSFNFCGYDDKGNLYLSAYPYDNSANGTDLVRLAKDSKSIDLINLKTPLWGSPSVQWDGKYITASSFSPNGAVRVLTVYRLSISGDNAVVVGTLKLKGEHHHDRHVGESWIVGSTIVGSVLNGTYGNVSFWPYANGSSKPTHTIKRVMDLSKGQPYGITVSPAGSR